MAGSSAAGLKLRVELRGPRHGWLDLVLGLGEDTCDVRISAIPSDSLTELAGAVRAFAERSEATSVRFNGEPTVHELSLSNLSSTLALLTLTRVERAAAPAMFAFKGARLELCATLWRALRRLEGAFPGGGSPDWPHPFPERDVAALSGLLRGTPGADAS